MVNIFKTIPKVEKAEKAEEEWGWRISNSLEDF
jgi:hypothetical protein